MSNKILFSDEQTKEILYLYTVKNISIRKIADQYNVGYKPITRILKENNITTKKNDFYRKKNCDENFFDIIDTEEKAYWLGFIYADGCLSKTKTCDRLEIKLAETDKNHLEKFKQSLQSEHHIGTYISSNGYNIGKPYCSLAIVNRCLADGLISKGISYQKTHILQFPNENQVPNDLISHFIRGYFDGDGSVYCHQDSGVGGISFTGTENMLNSILMHIKTVVPTNTQVHQYKNKDIYDLKIGGRNCFHQCYEYLYDNATIFLDRKKDKFEEILNEYNTK